MNERIIEDKSILDEFANKFISILEKYLIYAIVGGYVAIAHGRTRGTEDIDIVIDLMNLNKFTELHKELIDSGFECIQGDDPKLLFNDYLLTKDSIRYILKDKYTPEIELFFCKDEISKFQLKTRKKYPLTKSDFYFTSIEGNIAFKEYLLTSPKDMEDARFLRERYSNNIDEKEINRIKKLIFEQIIDKHDKSISILKSNNPYYSRDKSHIEQIIRSAKYANEQDLNWKKQHTEFLNSIYNHSNKSFDDILLEPDGKEKIRKLKGWNKKTPYWFEK